MPYRDPECDSGSPVVSASGGPANGNERNHWLRRISCASRIRMTPDDRTVPARSLNPCSASASIESSAGSCTGSLARSLELRPVAYLRSGWDSHDSDLCITRIRTTKYCKLRGDRARMAGRSAMRRLGWRGARGPVSRKRRPRIVGIRSNRSRTRRIYDGLPVETCAEGQAGIESATGALYILSSDPGAGGVRVVEHRSRGG